MALEIDVRKYASPVWKLVRFFRNSRNRWKSKCMAIKHAYKLLKNQVRAVERSRAHWKQVVEQQKRRIAELEVELQKTADALA